MAAESGLAPLRERAGWLREQMDDPACDAALLRNTYRQFARVNALFSAWHRVFDRHLAPRLTTGSTILDVGCGGGDLARRLAGWLAQAGTPVSVTAVDPDPRAIEFARAHPAPGVCFRQATAEDLLSAGERFDVVVSNHLLHHLSDAELEPFLDASAALASRVVVHNDMSRHAVAYAGFALTRPLFRRSYIVADGLTSIRRAFTPAELRLRVPDGWEVQSMTPFRNVVILER